jgi:hypothetical protein
VTVERSRSATSPEYFCNIWPAQVFLPGGRWLKVPGARHAGVISVSLLRMPVRLGVAVPGE